MANTTGQVMPDGTVQYYEDAMGRAMVSTDYDPTSSYAVGDYCIYDNVRYCCNTAIASGGETWNSAHWDVAKVDDDVTEIKQSLSNFGNIKVYQFFNTATLSIDLGFTPTSAKNGNAIMFNGNQGSAAIFRLDTSPSALNIAGSKTWTCTQSGSVVTFTANSTLWGVTTVIVDHN